MTRKEAEEELLQRLPDLDTDTAFPPEFLDAIASLDCEHCRGHGFCDHGEGLQCCECGISGRREP